MNIKKINANKNIISQDSRNFANQVEARIISLVRNEYVAIAA
jgi:hypothetical protein